MATWSRPAQVSARAVRKARARRVAEAFADDFPGRFPDARTERHVVEMLAKTRDLPGLVDAVAAASPSAADDPELLGLALDAHARMGDVDAAWDLALKLASAHAKRAATGVGASDRAAALPAALAAGHDEPPRRRPRGPPERLLRNFRRLCRSRGLDQPDVLPTDPVLWNRAGADLRRSKKGNKHNTRNRSYARV